MGLDIYYMPCIRYRKVVIRMTEHVRRNGRNKGRKYKRCPGGTRDSPKVDEGVPTKGAGGGGNASERGLLATLSEHGRKSKSLKMGIGGCP